jgi:hypothetical protein
VCSRAQEEEAALYRRSCVGEGVTTRAYTGVAACAVGAAATCARAEDQWGVAVRHPASRRTKVHQAVIRKVVDL